MFRDPQVNFYVEDVDAAARFYRDLFGFVETFRTPEHGAPTHVEMRLGQLTLGLATIRLYLGEALAGLADHPWSVGEIVALLPD